VSQWERDQVLQYPELQIFIDKLKDLIIKKPEKGLSDPLLLPGMKENLPCLKHSVNLSLFSSQYAIGYNFITASYLNGVNEIIIVRMDFS
jgi:hypothetical protein